METYASILLIAAPVFFIMVLGEKLYGYLKFGHDFKTMDTLSSLSSGFTNVLKDVLGLSLTILSYEWIYKHLSFFEIKSTWLTYIIAFIALDFAGYWIHRLAHNVNFFWNRHVIHHSSEEFNLACALRQSISVFINIFSFFLIPAAIFGVPPQVIAVIAPIHLFAQFWYHTIYIDKMGFLEKILVTPSHHRVHHAINEIYLDKNHAQIFIIWDKLFGTFQEELEQVKPVYGVTRPMLTWNPIKINFKHLALLIHDAWRAPKLLDKLKIWFMPTGWRPEGFEEKYPVKKIEDPYNFEKYATDFTLKGRVYVWFQFVFTLLFLMLFFMNIQSFSFFGMLTLGGFIFITIYAYTDFMDKNKSFIVFEIVRSLYALYIIFYTIQWDGLFSSNQDSKTYFLAYLAISFMSSIVLYRAELNPIEKYEVTLKS